MPATSRPRASCLRGGAYRPNLCGEPCPALQLPTLSRRKPGNAEWTQSDRAPLGRSSPVPSRSTFGSTKPSRPQDC